MTQATQNILAGILSAIWNSVWSIIIPLYIFQYLSQPSISEFGFSIGIEEYQIFRYWIISFGLLSTAFSFFKASSPKHSTRKAVAQLMYIIINCLYFYIYVVSGITTIASEMVVVEGTTVYFSLNLENMVYVNMGIYALNIIVGLYDLIISIVSPLEVKNEFTEEQHDKEKTIEKYGRFIDN